MLKNTFTILFLISAFSTFGQITITKAREKNAKIDNFKYDSTVNFLGNDVEKYIGQEFYLNGLSKSLRKYGYRDFVNDYDVNKRFDKSNVYNCCELGLSSKYESLANKYFTVLSVIKHPKAEDDEYIYGEKYYLKLQEKESKDIVYYEYDARFLHSFPFIVVGFYHKLKLKHIGSKFVVRGRNWINDDFIKDLKTGKSISEFNGGKVWKCVDVTIDEEYYKLSLIIENSIGEQIPLYIDNIDGDYWVYKLNDSEKYKKKFGLDIWTLIVNGKVKIGMTKEMCLLSWGNPKKINETITSNIKHEQWVYSTRFYPNSFLYFKNGILTSIQDDK